MCKTLPSRLAQKTSFGVHCIEILQFEIVESLYIKTSTPVLVIRLLVTN